MKKFLAFLLICVSLISCNNAPKVNTQTGLSCETLNDYKIIHLPAGVKVVNVYYDASYNRTRVVTETMPDNYTPSDKVIYNLENGNIVYIRYINCRKDI